MTLAMKKVLSEITHAVDSTRLDGYSDFLELIKHDSQNVVCTGAGRVGLAMKGFAMRLSHLGVNTHFLGETIVPHTGSGDLLIVGSGSGSTPSILRNVEIAKSKGLSIGLITSAEVSPMKNLADATVLIQAPNKFSSQSDFRSVQPMTTLFEQTLSIFLDATVLDLMVKFGESSETMSGRHNVIE
jgi:6-phospho-3-hexuloisomerase